MQLGAARSRPRHYRDKPVFIRWLRGSLCQPAGSRWRKAAIASWLDRAGRAVALAAAEDYGRLMDKAWLVVAIFVAFVAAGKTVEHLSKLARKKEKAAASGRRAGVWASVALIAAVAGFAIELGRDPAVDSEREHVIHDYRQSQIRQATAHERAERARNDPAERRLIESIYATPSPVYATPTPFFTPITDPQVNAG